MGADSTVARQAKDNRKDSIISLINPNMTSTTFDPVASKRRQLAQWYLRDKHRALWQLPLWIAIATGIALALLQSRIESPRRNLKKSTAALLALAPARVPDDKNAAVHYRRAFAGYVRFAKGAPNLDADLPGHPLTPHMKTQLQKYLASNGKALLNLKAGAGKEACDWKLNYTAGFGMLLPHLASMRQGARLMALEARWLASEGDHEEAAKTILAMYRMGRHLDRDPTLISGLVAVAIDALADSALQDIVRYHLPANQAELSAYRKALWTNRHPNQRWAHYINGEKTFGLHAIDTVFSIPGTGRAFLGATLPRPQGMYEIWYGEDRMCYETYMDDLIARGKKGHITETDFEETILKHQRGPAPLTRMIAPVLSRSLNNFIRSEDQARVTAVGMDVAAFRMKYGKLPTTLKMLIPEFFSELPKDHLGRPLRMLVDKNTDEDSKKKKPRFIRIYGVGENGIDNGGYNSKAPAPHPNAPDADDPVFVLPLIPETISTPGKN